VGQDLLVDNPPPAKVPLLGIEYHATVVCYKRNPSVNRNNACRLTVENFRPTIDLPAKREIGKAMDTPPETIVKKIDSILYEHRNCGGPFSNRRSVLTEIWLRNCTARRARALGTSMTVIWTGSVFAA
jgi:hypothetical protein